MESCYYRGREVYIELRVVRENQTKSNFVIGSRGKQDILASRRRFLLPSTHQSVHHRHSALGSVSPQFASERDYRNARTAPSLKIKVVLVPSTSFLTSSRVLTHTTSLPSQRRYKRARCASRISLMKKPTAISISAEQ